MRASIRTGNFDETLRLETLFLSSLDSSGSIGQDASRQPQPQPESASPMVGPASYPSRYGRVHFDALPC